MKDEQQGLGVYKHMEISYEELDAAMSKLGFEKKAERTKDGFREEIAKREIMELTYSHLSKGIKYTLLDQPKGKPVPKTEIVKISTMLYVRGFIKEIDDFAKSIEKQRLALVKAVV